MRDWQAQSDRLCDVTVAGFAAWTVCAHATTFLGGSLFDLLWVFAAVAADVRLRGPVPRACSHDRHR